MSVEQRTGILLVTHLDIGARIIQAAEFIMGPQEGVVAVGVEATDNVDATVAVIREAAAKVDGGLGVLALTDMFGGTPTNLSLSLIGTAVGEVITGVSLPMVLKAIQGRKLPPVQLAAEVKKAGTQGIVVAGEMLKRK